MWMVVFVDAGGLSITWRAPIHLEEAQGISVLLSP
jgi:hypothetical protein